MTVYIIRRLLQSLLILFALSIIFFLLVRFQPQGACGYGDQVCVQQLNLDQPVANQYLSWIGPYLHGDFGVSRGGQPVLLILSQKLPPTLLLVGISFFIQQAVALPMGIYAALRQYSRVDSLLSLGAYVALSFPGYVLGLLLLYMFGVQWRLLPVGHYEDPVFPTLWSSDWFGALAADPSGVIGDLAWHLLLPTFVLTVGGIAVDSRFMRASMLQVLQQQYIRTARATGLSRRRIIFKHALRNALPPIITNMALYLPTLIGGVIVVETVFTWGGLGYEFRTDLGSFDFPMLQAMLILSSLAVLLTNLLADITYGLLDPRVRY